MVNRKLGSLALILVTGASGHVGGAILRGLRSLGVEAVAMVRDPEARPPEIAIRNPASHRRL